jgi:hypothetical protein
MTIPSASTDGKEIEQTSQGDSASIGEPSVIRNISMDKMQPVIGSALEPAQKPAESINAGGSGGGLLDFAKGFFIKKMT